mgnify:CR=1 FL=1
MSSYLFKLNRYSIHDSISTHKRIQNTVRVSESEYVMNKASLTVQHESRDENNLNWNQMSDRLLKANTLQKTNPVPSHGNSRTSSLTRARPGSLKPGGYGVDVKHNSYARYLARKKGRTVLKQEQKLSAVNPKAVVNNKPRKYNIVRYNKCSCGPEYIDKHECFNTNNKHECFNTEELFKPAEELFEPDEELLEPDEELFEPAEESGYNTPPPLYV